MVIADARVPELRRLRTRPWRRLLLLGLCALSTSVGANTETPQGLWEAFTAARHAIEARGHDHIARNPRNEQSIAFRDGGVSVSPLAADTRQEPGWTWGLRLTGYGTPQRMRPVADPVPHVEETRLEYRRGPIVEWYENKPLGIEQGFTLSAPPTPGAAQLVLQLALDGGLRPEWQTPGQAVNFYTPEDEYALTYRDLKVLDARGEPLPAHLVVADAVLEIHADAHGAEWPVVVDPLVVNESAKLTAKDHSVLDGFGNSVALYEDTALIVASHADNDAGAVYVFVYQNGRGWKQQQKLQAGKDSDSLLGLGSASASLWGDTAVVGAPLHSFSAYEDGSAYVFVRKNGVWSQQARLHDDRAPAYTERTNFGSSVAIWEDTVVVGHVRKLSVAHGGSKKRHVGGAEIFTRNGSDWISDAALMANDHSLKVGPSYGALDQFGKSVAVFGDTIIIGAPGMDWDDYRDEETVDMGAAYVFVRDANGWAQQAKLVASDARVYDHCGWAVALYEDTALMGCDHKSWRNKVYVFVRNGSQWHQQEVLTASDGGTADHFGRSVALSGDIALVGGGPDLGAKAENAGAAYRFVREGNTWRQVQKLISSDNDKESEFGSAVAMSATSIAALVGAPGKDSYTGAAYVFSPTLGGKKPDFAVKHIELDPARPRVGESFKASVHVENRGTATGDAGVLGVKPRECDSSVDVCLTVVTPVVATKDVGTIDPGSYKRINFEFDVPRAGHFVFQAIADLENDTTESNENNNFKALTYTAEERTGKPDFVIESITLDPTYPRVGGTFTARICVKNQGTAGGQIGALFLNTNACYSKGEGTCLPLEEKTLVPFNPWLEPDRASSCFRWTPASEPRVGRNFFRAKVAAQYEKEESDETNNIEVLEYVVGGDGTMNPDFVVKSIKLRPPRPGPGEPFAADVEVMNLGLVNGDAKRLDVWITDPPYMASCGETGDSFRLVGILAPNETKAITFNGLSWRWAGDQLFRAHIDSGCESGDQVRQNNQITKFYLVGDDDEIFVLNTYSVKPVVGKGGAVTPSAEQFVFEGELASFTVSPKEGFVIDRTVGGTCPQGRWRGETWTTRMITASCTVHFEFSPDFCFDCLPSWGGWRSMLN